MDFFLVVVVQPGGPKVLVKGSLYVTSESSQQVPLLCAELPEDQ